MQQKYAQALGELDKINQKIQSSLPDLRKKVEIKVVTPKKKNL